MSFSDHKPIPMTSQEEKEIHRVFEILCDFQEKSKIKSEIADLENWVTSHKNRSFIDSQSEASITASQGRIDELKGQLQAIELKPEKKISCGDVMEIFKWLKQKTTKKEVEEMIWEVDENLDGHLDWDEFRLMFNRNIMDRTGLEPSRMVSLLRFVMAVLINGTAVQLNTIPHLR